MKIQLHIAASDCDYTDHLSNILAEYHADVFDVSVCSAPEHLHEHLAARKFDVALFDVSAIENADLQSVHLPLLLWSDEEVIPLLPGEIKTVRKYQRISSMVSSVLELCAKEQTNVRGLESKKAQITAVWSPVGGVGKTTVALAYASNRVACGKQVLYLDLESFSSVHAYFGEAGRSISAVFELLETGEGNIKMLIRSIMKQDSESEISYFCRPENFDDMNILTIENIAVLVEACGGLTDELVIDMSCVCDERTRKVLELADRILLVTDPAQTAQIKLSQFVSQHSIFQRVKGKTTLVANRGATVGDPLVNEVIYFPFVQSSDAATVYKTLSGIDFGV